MRNSFYKWLPMAVMITLFCGVSYAVVQHTIRMSANNPQVQMAEDIASAIDAGAAPASFDGGTKIEISQSLAPYIIIYGSDGKISAASAVLDGAAPEIPAGVLDYARANNENRVTWQPRAGVRSAIVAVKYDGGGVVVAGRSMRESENLIGDLGVMIALGWFATIFFTFIMFMFSEGRQV